MQRSTQLQGCYSLAVRRNMGVNKDSTANYQNLYFFPSDNFSELIFKGRHEFWKGLIFLSFLWQYKREAVQKLISMSNLKSSVRKRSQVRYKGNICSFSQMPHSLLLSHRCFIFFSTSSCEKIALNIKKFQLISFLWFKYWKDV